MADTKARFTYFDGRGLGEAARLALSAAGIEYEDVYLRSRAQFLQLIDDGKLLFKQVPLLEIDGENLIGSTPIVRYVCHRAKLEGKTDVDQARIEELVMGARDMCWGCGLGGYKFQKTPEDQEKALQGAIQKVTERYLPVFEKVLAESKSGFLVGNSMSMADIMFFDGVSYLHDIPEAKSSLDGFPRCTSFIGHFSAQPGIKEYLASPRRHPPPSDAYVKEVNIILNR